MNPNTMTLALCCDKIAEAKGFIQDREPDNHGCMVPTGLWRYPDGTMYIGNGPLGNEGKHPIPPSLDALDRVRPEGWDWSIGTRCAGDTFVDYEGVADRWVGSRSKELAEVHAPDRLTCEARLVVAMLMAEVEGT